MTVSEIRQKYLDFFHARGHSVIPSARLVPENDPTTLFTGSGMQPLIPYLLGQSHSQGTRLVDSQKSFRALDIEEIGDNRHTTFFEMLGNWSLGDYFKKEQIPWFWEFLTEELKLDPERIFVTCFIGEPKHGLPKDTESAEIWREIFEKAGISSGMADIGAEEKGSRRGMKEGERIFFYDAKKNWWSRAGVPDNMPLGEPGGGDTEMFYLFPDITHDKKFGEYCHVNCDCGRFIELGNSVFMEYVKTEKGFEPLPKKNVDYGGGLERITAAENDVSDVFRIDVMQSLIREIESTSGKAYDDPAHQVSFRIITDHMRAAVFMLGDGVSPSNTDQGYIARRLIRRAVRHMDKLGVPEGTSERLVRAVISSYKDQYPELAVEEKNIQDAIREEENRFRKTLSQGLKEFEKILSTVRNEGRPTSFISGKEAFVLFSTYGFPLELTEELAKERNTTINRSEFEEEMKKHQATSRAGAEQKFAGGLADHSEATIKYHTAHHLLLKALQVVLGAEVRQRGSNITSERLRIDFSFGRKMTDDEKKKVEELVNQKIAEEIPVVRTDMKKEEAEKLGAEHEFGVKYPDMVSVYSVGPLSSAFSIEFCGGPHVSNTSDIARVRDSDGSHRKGVFKIVKEEAVAQGIRRIKAMVE